MCSYCSSCLDLAVALIDFQVEVFPSHLHHFCQGYYVLLNDIDFYRGERNICRNCVDKLGVGGKSEKLKKVGDSTVSRTIELWGE